MDKNKYFIYAHKSSESEDRQVLSLDSQVNEIKKFAQSKHIIVQEIFTEAKSAKLPGRPIFNEMVNQIKQKRANGLLVWNPDRLSRNSVDAGYLIYLLDTNVLSEIITPYQTFINTPNDKFLLSILWGQAKLENDNKSVNVKRGMKAKVDLGWYPHNVPNGYLNTPEKSKGNKIIVQDPERFELVRKMWDILLTGKYSVPQVQNIINKEYGFKTRYNKPISRNTTYKLFKNPFYFGYFYYEERLYKGKHMPMITEEEFEKAQAIIGRPDRGRTQKHILTFSDLVKCGNCGYSIVGTKKTKYYKNTNRLAHYVSYRCSRKSKIIQCKEKPISEKALIKQIDFILSSIEIDEDFKDWAITYLHEVHDQEVIDRTLSFKRQQTAYNNIQAMLDDLLDLKLTKAISIEEYTVKKEKLLKEQRRLKEKLNDTENRAAQWLEKSEKAFNFACYAKEHFKNGNVDDRKSILRGIGSNFILESGIISLKLEKPFLIFKESKEKKMKEIQRFEPPENFVLSTKTLELAYQNPTWYSQPWINITFDLPSIIHAFQDLRYIGELRQRWEEIKKLQNSNSLAFA